MSESTCRAHGLRVRAFLGVVARTWHEDYWSFEKGACMGFPVWRAVTLLGCC